MNFSCSSGLVLYALRQCLGGHIIGEARCHGRHLSPAWLLGTLTQLGDSLPAGAHLLIGFDYKYCLCSPANSATWRHPPCPGRSWGRGRQVVQDVSLSKAAQSSSPFVAAPAAALEHPLDRCRLLSLTSATISLLPVRPRSYCPHLLSVL